MNDFECIYDEHVSCFSVIRCNKCGTYIFEYYDERYEPNLKCPVCTDYKTGFKYYTKEDIEQNINKQKEISIYEEFSKSLKEADERYIKRNGLYDWELTHKKTIFKNKIYTIDIQFIQFEKCGLQAEINIWKKKDNIMTCKHHIKVPISPKTIWFFIKYKVKWKITWDNV